MCWFTAIWWRNRMNANPLPIFIDYKWGFEISTDIFGRPIPFQNWNMHFQTLFRFYVRQKFNGMILSIRIENLKDAQIRQKKKYHSLHIVPIIHRNSSSMQMIINYFIWPRSILWASKSHKMFIRKLSRCSFPNEIR